MSPYLTRDGQAVLLSSLMIGLVALTGLVAATAQLAVTWWLAVGLLVLVLAAAVIVLLLVAYAVQSAKLLNE